MERFPASWDKSVRTITVSVWILLVAVHLLVAYAAFSEPSLQDWERLVLVSIPLIISVGVLGGAYLFAPRGFSLTGEGVRVERLVGSFTIPYLEIAEAKLLEELTWKGLRLFGVGGFYGFYGLYYSSGIGKFWAYTGRRSKLILLELKDGRKLVLGPEPPEAFLEALKRRVSL